MTGGWKAIKTENCRHLWLLYDLYDSKDGKWLTWVVHASSSIHVLVSVPPVRVAVAITVRILHYQHSPHSSWPSQPCQTKPTCWRFLAAVLANNSGIASDLWGLFTICWVEGDQTTDSWVSIDQSNTNHEVNCFSCSTERLPVPSPVMALTWCRRLG